MQHILFSGSSNILTRNPHHRCYLLSWFMTIVNRTIICEYLSFRNSNGRAYNMCPLERVTFEFRLAYGRPSIQFLNSQLYVSFKDIVTKYNQFIRFCLVNPVARGLEGIEEHFDLQQFNIFQPPPILSKP